MGVDTLDTFPKLLLEHAARDPDRHAIREKELGIWNTWTWREYRDQIRALACGLASLGFKRGDKLAIVGDNRPRLYGAMCAVQCLGGVPVPVYQDSVAEEMQFVLEHAEVRFAIGEDQEPFDLAFDLGGLVERQVRAYATRVSSRNQQRCEREDTESHEFPQGRYYRGGDGARPA